ncbi:fatty acid cis/trans isomerase [Variovorax rhizosphaerae]|uniref:Fatty acid cis/trans isomerase n=1 Tax=Variovorax rhizosphaerae TaxID=1836200 RepID=A0ABU8WH61_9BURK
MSKRILWPIVILLVAACATLAGGRFDKLFGPADPTRFDARPAGPASGDYVRAVQPILDRRCVVCHACNDAPCQFKATSWEGIARGASKTPVYDATRLLAAEPSRLYVDADKTSQWRELDFFPVLNEHAVQTPEANKTAGLMHRLLALKKAHPGPTTGVVGGGLDFSLERSASCPAGEEIAHYERTAPMGGMPFGLPALSTTENDTLTRWLADGAPAAAPPTPTALALQRVAQWERFFNGDSLKEQLFSRYAYEHLFLAHLWFDDDPQRQFFKLVRSETPPGEPVRIVRSRRPVDSPEVDRVYYRIVPERETIVDKTHMPYVLSAQRMARWRELFLDPAYEVTRLPGYSAQDAANPFSTFAALPVNARYRFMLDEAEFTIMGFIKGPVCRGQMALNVIRDRFWVVFVAPEKRFDEPLSALLARDANLLRLPTGSSNTNLLVPWAQYARLENEYLKSRSSLLANAFGKKRVKLDLDLIWNGDGRNDNAALTVFRHYDSASVVKGLVGDTPRTAWVIGYPLLERIHYLLVADYDVYGNVGHQLNSRMYMDFLRMEGEFNFITLLPRAQREAVRDAWYRGDSRSTREQVYGGPGTTLTAESAVRYKTADARQELMGQLKTRLGPVLDTRLDLAVNAPPALRAPLRELAAIQGESLQWLPEVALLVVDTPGGPTNTFTLLRNTAHASVSHLLGERKELRPEEDTVTVVPGVVGSYPNAFYRLDAAQLPALVDAIRQLRSEQDYTAFAQRWAVRRTSPVFWAVSDDVIARYMRSQPLEAGVLDYNRLENR